MVKKFKMVFRYAAAKSEHQITALVGIGMGDASLHYGLEPHIHPFASSLCEPSYRVDMEISLAFC